MAAAADKLIVAKEHFVFTDPEGQLYRFSVEGNSIKEGTKIDKEGGLGTTTTLDKTTTFCYYLRSEKKDHSTTYYKVNFIK